MLTNVDKPTANGYYMWKSLWGKKTVRLDLTLKALANHMTASREVSSKEHAHFQTRKQWQLIKWGKCKVSF